MRLVRRVEKEFQTSMPEYLWRTTIAALQPVLNAWPPPQQEATTLVLHSIWSIDGLHYLVDVNADAFGPNRRLFGHHEDTVALNHVRWAVVGAITAIDLAAAALARRSDLPGREGREADLRSLERNRAQLTQGGQDWVQAVVDDPNYSELERIRHALVHRRVPRHIHLAISEPAGVVGRQLSITIPHPDGTTHQLSADEIIILATNVATAHVETFLANVVMAAA